MNHYEQVLEEIRKKRELLASEYVPELYLILRDEERLLPEKCRVRIELDCEDIWNRDTIRKYLPPETKSATKRKAGKISAQVKKKKRKEPKLLAAIATDTGQCSEVFDNDRDTSDKSDNSVGVNPTENSSVEQKEQESSPFRGIGDSQDSRNVWTEDYSSHLITDIQLDEFRELLEDLSPDERISECLRDILFLPSRLAEQISLRVHESRVSGTTPNFELEHNGICITSVRLCSNNGNLPETSYPLKEQGNTERC